MDRKKYLVLIVALLCTYIMSGQVVPPPAPAPLPPGLPINGGLVFLLALGILYGIKKAKD